MEKYSEIGIKYKIEGNYPRGYVYGIYPLHGFHNSRDIAQLKTDLQMNHKAVSFRIYWEDVPWEPLVNIDVKNDMLRITGLKPFRIGNLYIPNQNGINIIADTVNFVTVSEDALNTLKFRRNPIQNNTNNYSDITLEQFGKNKFRLEWKGKLQQSFKAINKIKFTSNVNINPELFRRQ